MRDVELSPIRHTAGTSGGGFGDMVTKPVTPRSQESRVPGEARVPLSPHPPRQEIDPRLEIFLEPARCWGDDRASTVLEWTMRWRIEEECWFLNHRRHHEIRPEASATSIPSLHFGQVFPPDRQASTMFLLRHLVQEVRGFSVSTLN